MIIKMVDFVSISVAVISLVLAVIGIGLGGYCLNQLNSQTTNGKVGPGPPGPPGPPGTPGSGSGTGGGSNDQSSNFTTEQVRKLKIFIDQMNILESDPKVFDVNGVIGAIRLQTDRINFKNSTSEFFIDLMSKYKNKQELRENVTNSFTKNLKKWSHLKEAFDYYNNLP